MQKAQKKQQKVAAPKKTTKVAAKKVAKKPVKVQQKRSMATAAIAKPAFVAPAPLVAPKLNLQFSKLSFAQPLRVQRRFMTNPANYLQDPKAVEQRIFDVLGRFDKVPKDKLTSTAMFQKDLGLDSLDRVEVVLAIEEEFNTEFTDEQSDKFMGVSDVVDYVARMPDVHQRTYKADDL